jgi:hypothetical protein
MHDLVAPYALDALDPHESALFEAHLESCSRCRSQLADMTEAAGELAESAAVRPPPGLKAAVMAEIGEPAVAPVVEMGSRRRSRLAWSVATAAAVIALVFFGLWAVTNNELGQADQIAAVYESPDARVIDLDSPLGPVRFVFSAELGRGVLNGGSLSDLDDADLYEIWLIGNDAPVPSGTLVAGETAVLVEGVEPGLVLAVTVEPAPGSDAPTSDPILAAEL